MPRVYNLHFRDDAPVDSVLIDRRTKYGNPIKVSARCSRRQACDRFEAQYLPEMDVSELRGKNLLCWCAPQGGSESEPPESPWRCHGHSILKKANS